MAKPRCSDIHHYRAQIQFYHRVYSTQWALKQWFQQLKKKIRDTFGYIKMYTTLQILQNTQSIYILREETAFGKSSKPKEREEDGVALQSGASAGQHLKKDCV